MEIQFLFQQLINGLSKGSIYALIAVGFALIFSVLKISNFAHGGMISISAFVGYFLSAKLGMGLLPTTLFAALAGGILGIILDTIAFSNIRKRKSPKVFYFVSSITCGILFMNILTVFFGTTYYALPNFFENPVIELGSLIIVKIDLVIFLACIALLIVLMLIINKTKLGLAIRTVALDDSTARLMGINSNYVIKSTFFMAGALAGVSGVFLGANYTIDPFLGSMVVKGFIASVVGGLGSLGGAIAGAVLLGIVEVALTVVTGDIIAPAIVFVITLIFLLIRPQGIAGKIIHDKV